MRLYRQWLGLVVSIVGIVITGFAAFTDPQHVFLVQHRSGVLFIAGILTCVAGFWLRVLGRAVSVRPLGRDVREPFEADSARSLTLRPQRLSIGGGTEAGPETTWQFTGGIWLDGPSLGRLTASWPFAQLTIGDRSLRITLNFASTFAKIVFVFYLFGKLFQLNRTYDLPFDAIDVVEKQRGVISTGVRIRHHAEAPAFIVFWSGSFGSNAWREILRLLAERGVPVKPAMNLQAPDA